MPQTPGFTPGPWKAERNDWCGEPSPHKVYISGNYYECYGDEEEEDGPVETCATAVAIVEGNATSGTVTAANACLIAEAPALLAACESLLASNSESNINAAIEAVRRAKGGP